MTNWNDAKWAAAGVTAAALVMLGGCGGGGDADADGTDAGEQASDAVETALGQAGDAFAEAGQAAADAGEQVAEAVEEAVSDIINDQDASTETPEGTVRIYLASMARGEFEKALDVIHPDAEGYESVLTMAGGMEQIRQRVANGEMPPFGLEFAEVAFTGAFKGASFEEVVVQPPNAKYVLSFSEGSEPVEVDLLQVEGRWLIQLPKDGAPLATETVGQMAQQLQSPAGPPDPAAP